LSKKNYQQGIALKRQNYLQNDTDCWSIGNNWTSKVPCKLWTTYRPVKTNERCCKRGEADQSHCAVFLSGTPRRQARGCNALPSVRRPWLYEIIVRGC